MSVWIIVPLASIACYSTLLAINFRQSDHGKVSNWFSLYLASMIFWSFGSFLAHLEQPGINTLLWNRVLTAGSTAMPLIFYTFVQFFLRKERKWLLGITLSLFIVIQAANLGGLVIESAYVSEGRLHNEYGPAILLPSIVWPLFICLSAVEFANAYRRSKDSIYKNRIKYLLSAILVIFCGGATNSTSLSVYPIDIGFNVIAAGLIAYAILRYQLLDLSVVIRKSLVYSIPTILIGVLHFLAIFSIWQIFDTFNTQTILIGSLMVAVLGGVIVQPLRDRVQVTIDRLLFREKHDVGLMLRRISSTAAAFLDLQALTGMILKEINTNLHVSRSAFFIKSISGDDFDLSTQEGREPFPTMRFRKDHPAVVWLVENDRPLRQIDLEIFPQFMGLWGQEREDLSQLGIELFVPVKAKGVLVGILAMGPKRSGETFSLDDLATLVALAGQIAVAIENARLYADAQKRTAEMTKLNGAIQSELSERLRAEQALMESEERFRRLAENAPDLIYRYCASPDRGYEFISSAVSSQLGYLPEEILADPVLAEAIVHPDDLPVFRDLIQGRFSNHPVVMRFVRKDGSIIWAEQHSVAIYDPNGQLTAVEGITRDITKRKSYEEELAERIQQLEQHNREISLLNEMGDLLQNSISREEAYPIIRRFLKPLFSAESGLIYMMNQQNTALALVSAWGEDSPPQETMMPGDCWAVRRGKPHLQVEDDTAMQCQHIPAARQPVTLCVPLMNQREVLGLLTMTVPEDWAEAETRLSPSKQQLAQTVAEHITLALANLKLTETLREQAIRDPLTDLFNRRYMEETLERELARAGRKNSSLGILFIDIDHFKQFNDMFGHDAGDRVLRKLGAFLQVSVRKEDIACRYGGEEFVLILPDTSPEAICQRAEEIRVGGKELIIQLPGEETLTTITLSIGASIFPVNGQTARALLKAADRAMYQAKQTGRNRVVLASAEI